MMSRLIYPINTGSGGEGVASGTSNVIPRPDVPGAHSTVGTQSSNMPSSPQSSVQQISWKLIITSKPLPTRLIHVDNSNYFNRVRLQYLEHPHVYDKFLTLMDDYKNQLIDMPYVMQKVSNLFRDHTELIYGFNELISPCYEIKIQSDELGSSVPVASMSSTSDTASLHQLQTTITGTQSSSMSSFSQSPEQQTSWKLIMTSKWVPQAVPLRHVLVYCGNYLDKVKSQFPNQPQVYCDFLTLSEDYENCLIGVPYLMQKLSSIFRGHTELIYGFNAFLPSGSEIVIQSDELGSSVPVASMSSPSDTKGLHQLQTTITGTQSSSMSLFSQSQVQLTSWKLIMTSKLAPLGDCLDTQSSSMPSSPQSSVQETSWKLIITSKPLPSRPTDVNSSKYFNRVRLQYIRQPHVYKKFLTLMEDYKNKLIGMLYVMQKVSNLFRDHTELIYGFNELIPPCYEINQTTITGTQSSSMSSFSQSPEQQTSCRLTLDREFEECYDYLIDVKAHYLYQPHVYCDYMALLCDYNNQLIFIPYIMQKVSNLFKGNTELIYGFNEYLPSGSEIVIQSGSSVPVASMSSPSGSASLHSLQTKGKRVAHGDESLSQTPIQPSASSQVTEAAVNAATTQNMPLNYSHNR